MKKYLYRIKNKINSEIVLWLSICIVGLIGGFVIGFFYDKHRSFNQIKEFISISTQLGTFCTFLFLVVGKMKESIEEKEKARLVESSYNTLKLYEYLGKEKNDVINGSGDKREHVVRNILSNLDCIDRYSNNNIVKKYTFEFKQEFKYEKDAELDAKLFSDLGYYLNSIEHKIRK